MKRQKLIAYDRETHRRFPRHDHYDFNIIRPLLQSTFGKGLINDSIVQISRDMWTSRPVQDSIEQHGLMSIEYLPHSVSFRNIALNIRQALEMAKPIDVGAWLDIAFEAMSEAEKTRVKAEHLVEVGGALFNDDEMKIFDKQARLSPAKLFEQFLLCVADPELATIATPDDAEKAKIFNENLRTDISHAISRGKKAGMLEAERLIENELALLADTDPKRLAYADALAKAQREDMAYSTNPLDRFKAGIGNFTDSLATFQQRLKQQALEAENAGGVRSKPVAVR